MSARTRTARRKLDDLWWPGSIGLPDKSGWAKELVRRAGRDPSSASITDSFFRDIEFLLAVVAAKCFGIEEGGVPPDSVSVLRTEQRLRLHDVQLVALPTLNVRKFLRSGSTRRVVLKLAADVAKLALVDDVVRSGNAHIRVWLSWAIQYSVHGQARGRFAFHLTLPPRGSTVQLFSPVRYSLGIS